MDKQLNQLIHFWEAKLLEKGMYSPSVIVLIELTVKYLKELALCRTK